MLVATTSLGRAGVDRLLEMPPDARARAVKLLSPEEQQAIYLSLRHDWRRWARPEQQPPDGAWDIWILLAGRGGGKTRPAAQQVNHWAAHPEDFTNGEMPRFLLVAKDEKQYRDVMVEGDSGILATAPPWGPQPRYEPGKARVTWYDARGREQALAELHSARAPKTLRGPQGHKGWGDEIAAWKAAPGKAPEAWSEGLDMAVRLGRVPQIILTTTPTQTEFIAELCYGPKTGSKRIVTADQLMASEIGVGRGVRRWSFAIPSGDGSSEVTVVSQWPTDRNRGNLPPGKVSKWRAKYGGTRLEQQELDGLILEQIEGALFTQDRINRDRVAEAPEFTKKAVAVDPTRADEPGDECGIMVGGRGKDGDGFLIADKTVKGSPDVWARAAVGAYHTFGAHFLVYESNGMGMKMRQTIETVDPTVNWIAVPTIEDKLARAGPISALSEQGRIHHVGLRDDDTPGAPDDLDVLEAELVGWDPKTRKSPNRLDAYVWLFTALMLGLPKESPLVGPGSVTKGSSWRR